MLPSKMRLALSIVLGLSLLTGVAFFYLRSVAAQEKKEARSVVQPQLPAPAYQPAAPESPTATVITAGNTAPIVINDNTAAALYPSTVTISGVTPALTKVRVLLGGLTHTFPDDVDIILEGPQGQRAMLMSDAGGSDDVSDIDVGFDPTSANVLPDATALAGGTFRPANYGNSATDLTDTFPAPFPAPNTLTDAPADLSVFNLTNPNGTWKLYVVDDAGQDTGTIARGWFLFVTVPTIFTVNSTADPGNGVCDAAECTLREAISAALANTGDSDLVNFSTTFNTPQTINLQNALPDLSESITINGPGANLLTVQRAFNATTDFRIFTIPAGVSQVDIRGMTISNGRTSESGGGIESASFLVLTSVTVAHNQAVMGGGGVYLSNNGLFTNCTFTANTTSLFGGGIRYGGRNGSRLRIVNSTVSGNSVNSGGLGAGILNFSSSGNSHLEVVNSTIVNNTGRAGITTTAIADSGSFSFTTLRNSLIANNALPNLQGDNLGTGNVTSQGFNLTNDNGSGYLNQSTDLINRPPLLGSLALNGGPTPTHALLGGSPALNAGDASGQATDQRGVARPTTGADIGAVEMQALTVTNANDAGAGSLRAAITAANANADLNDIIFDNAAFNTPQTITLLTALPDLTGSLTLNGAGANLLTVTRSNAAADFRIFHITAAVNVAMSGLTISNGRVTGSGFGGGIRSATGNLTLTNVHVTGNQAGFGGGGVSLALAEGVFTGCTFSSNAATDGNSTAGGGGIYYQGGGNHTLRVVSSTMSGNNAAFRGGGIFHVSSNAGSRLEVSNSTIFNNTANGGGGIFTATQSDPNSTATTTLRNSIIANNSPNNLATGTAGGGAATVTSHGFNLASDDGGGFLTQSTDKINAFAGLAALGDNGGTTPTHALLGNSNALDAGNNSGSGTLTDQRGGTFRRTVDLPSITNANGSDGTDIGAFEAQAAPTDTAPTATASTFDVTSAGGTSYSVGVTYTDDAAINVSTIGSTDISVTGPNGFSAALNFFPPTPNTNGTPRSVTYFFTPPGGSWDIADNGTYNVVMRANEVGDLTGNFVAAGPLGAFTVNIAAPTPTPTATPTPTPCVPVTTSYTGPPVTIPDNAAAGVSIPLNLSGFTGNIADLNFRLDAGAGACNNSLGNTNASVDHTFLNDLAFTLRSPAGTTVPLITRRGGEGDNFCTILLDDDGGFPSLSTMPVTGGVAGNFAPESPLSAFDGQNPNGTWTLNVADLANQDTGSLRRFSLIVTPQTCGAATPSVIDFSAANFSASESAGFATITVNRTNPFDVASVDYKTNDSFDFTTCSTITSGADQRCDYAATAGTLNFAAGETSKTFAIPLTDDFYVEINETLSLALANPTGGTLGNQPTATLTITNVEDATQVMPASNRWFAFLSGTQEVPTVNSTATGFGRVDLNQAETQITVNLSFSGLSSAQSAAHIHGAAHVGQNAPILFNLNNGTVTNQTFAVTPAQVAQLKAGLFYFNIHTANFPNGEIRGQILPNPLESARYFVRQQYHDFLSRVPDQAGEDFWTGQIATVAGTDLTLIRQRRVAVSNAFFFELEYQQTGAYTYRLYREAFGNTQPFGNPNGDMDAHPYCTANPQNCQLIRAAHVPSYQRFTADRATLNAGNLAATQLALATTFAQRAEFVGRYPVSQTAEQFVDALLANIQAASGANLTSQRTALLGLFNNAGGGNAGRGAVLFRLAEDNAAGNPINNRAFIDAEYNKAFVTTQYFGYLRRDADMPGLNFWLSVVNQFPLRSAAGQNGMVCAFITSSEYQQRFNGYFTRTNQTDCQ